MTGIREIGDTPKPKNKIETQVWFRDPHSYVKELAEVGEGHIVWSRGALIKRRIDPLKHANIYFQQSVDWKLRLVGPQGTAEYDRSCKDQMHPLAVYPTWDYNSDDSVLLEDILANPVGEDEEICSRTDAPADETPVFGQKHVVIVQGFPPTSTGIGKRFMRHIVELGEEYPEASIHVYGLWGWQVAFGLGFKSVDIDPRAAASANRIVAPNGKDQNWELFARTPQWVSLLGVKVADLNVPRNRCMYNIKSALWAAEHYRELYKFNTSPGTIVDPDTMEVEPDKRFTKTHMSQEKKKLKAAREEKAGGDAFYCETCRLQDGCKYYRAGAVCAVPGAEPKNLSVYFNTRDSDLIIDGLGQLLATQAKRLDQGLQDENIEGELSSEVTKIINQLFSNGTKLAKLVNPALAGGTKVQVNVGTGGAAQVVSNAQPRQMIGAVVRELESRGIDRKKITPDMIQGVLEGMADGVSRQHAIEGEAIVERD